MAKNLSIRAKNKSVVNNSSSSSAVSSSSITTSISTASSTSSTVTATPTALTNSNKKVRFIAFKIFYFKLSQMFHLLQNIKGRIKTILDDSIEKKSSKKAAKDKSNNNNNGSSSSSSSSSSSANSLSNTNSNKKIKTSKLKNSDEIYDDDSMQATDTLASNQNEKTVIKAAKSDVNVNKEQMIVDKIEAPAIKKEDEQVDEENVEIKNVDEKDKNLIETQLKPANSEIIKEATIVAPDVLQFPSNSSSSYNIASSSSLSSSSLLSTAVAGDSKIISSTNMTTDSKLSLLLKLNENDVKQHQQIIVEQPQVDKNKEIAAHLLADLSLNKIEVDTDQQQLAPIISPSVQIKTENIEIKISPNSNLQINDLLNKVANNIIISPASSSTTTINQTISKKAKKNISSLLESPKKSSPKISSLVNQAATVAAATTSPVITNFVVNNDETEKQKSKKPKLKRKSIDDTTTSIASTSTVTAVENNNKHKISPPLPITTTASTKQTVKRRKQQTNETNNLSIDMFGNRLSSIDCLPVGCTNDFEMMDEEQNKQQPVDNERIVDLKSSSQPKTSTISSILNKKTPFIGPPKPILNSQYKILEDDQTMTNELVNFLFETSNHCSSNLF